MNGQIALVGSINMDIVIRTSRMPLPGETIKGYDFHIIPGGKTELSFPYIKII